MNVIDLEEHEFVGLDDRVKRYCRNNHSFCDMSLGIAEYSSMNWIMSNKTMIEAF